MTTFRRLDGTTSDEYGYDHLDVVRLPDWDSVPAVDVRTMASGELRAMSIPLITFRRVDSRDNRGCVTFYEFHEVPTQPHHWTREKP